MLGIDLSQAPGLAGINFFGWASPALLEEVDEKLQALSTQQWVCQLHSTRAQILMLAWHTLLHDLQTQASHSSYLKAVNLQSLKKG